MRITIIPDVVYEGITTNYGITNDSGVKGVKRLKKVRLIPEEPMTITIPDNPVRKKFVKIQNANLKELAGMINGVVWENKDILIGKKIYRPDDVRRMLYQRETNPITAVSTRGGRTNKTLEELFIKTEIRKKLNELIRDAVQVGLDNDIGMLVDDSKSPPEVIGGYETKEQFAQDETAWIKANIKSTFQVVRDTDYLERLQFGQERVFLRNAPRIAGHNQFYQQRNNLGLSCAYEYLINTFGNKAGYKKIAKNKQTIDFQTTLPTPESKGIYEEWCKLYSEEFANGNTDIDLLPNYIETQDIEDELYKVREVRFDKKWSKQDIDKSLSVLDLVKWCIVAKVRLNVIDHSNSYYLTYNPETFKHKYIRTPSNSRRNISVKVKYNHAYFIEDPIVKNVLSNTDTKINFGLELWNNEKDDYEENKEEIDYQYIINAYEDDWTFIEPKTRPPPTADRLIELMGEENRTNYYVNRSNLNGLVNYLYKVRNISPDALSGSISTIHSASYKQLRIYSNKKKPPNEHYLEKDEYNTFYQDYAVKTYKGKVPTATDVAEILFKASDEKAEDYRSMFNSQTRKIFFENEIKPDNRNSFSSEDVVSFDWDKAYTTALRNNTYEWNIYDSVSQPRAYRDNFNPNYFYLCRNRDDDFPLRGGNGKLILYHGCLIQHLMDRVEIIYYFEPVRTLKVDYFHKFLDEVDKYFEKGYRFEKPKTLVNNFVGNLKKKDGITDYKIWLVDNKTTIMRELIKGRIPCQLVPNHTAWNKECCIVGYPKHQHHFQSGQPLRLQVMEMTNEQNYLFYKHYQTCLNSAKFIHKFQNHKNQRTILKKIRNKKSLPSKVKEWNYKSKLVAVRTDALYFQQPAPTHRTILFNKYVVDSWNNSHNWNVKGEGNYDNEEFNFMMNDYKPQIPVKFIPNKWDTEIDIRKKWDKDTDGKYYLNIALKNGGGWFSGLGGRGKSELVLTFDRMIKRNQIRFRFIKAYYQTKYPANWFEKCEEWKLDNPIYIRKFAPTNKACNRIGGKTLNRGLGIPVFNDVEKAEEGESEDKNEQLTSGRAMETILSTLQGRMKKDGDTFNKRFRTDVIVIDELSMVNGRMLSYLAYIKLRIPTIRFLLMGDLAHQLKPVGEEYRNFINSFVIKELANFNKLTLHYNFRTGKDKDELWEKCQTPEVFNNQRGELTRRNLSYTHNTRQKVIEECQEKFVENPIVVETNETKKEGHTKYFKYSYGTPVIARKSNSVLGFFNNEMWCVVGLGDLVGLWNIDRKVNIKLEQKDFVRYFLSGFCITIHKSQSETYDDEYTIHDWKYISNKTSTNQRLRYTAMSRSSDYENKVFVK